jgi:co-chaperonin GroES (HSP10)
MSDHLERVRMKGVRPFWALHGRASVLPSDATEQEHGGIVIPTAFEGSLNRGVVIHLCGDTSGILDQGDVIFYRGDGIKVGDVILVDLSAVYAYEVDQ